MRDEEFKNITRGTKSLIEQTIKETGITNRNELCGEICEKLEEKFKDKTFDYQLQRMGLEKTTDVLDAIDAYMFKSFKESNFSEKKAKK